MTDRLVPEEIAAGLRGPCFRGPVHCYPTVDSTNTVAREMAERGAPAGTLVVAEEQLSGRGRQRRTWHSPPGLGLWFSLLVRPRGQPSSLAPLTIVTSLAVAAAIRDEIGPAVRLKWPNDVMIDERKVAGVLAELASEAGEVAYVVIGVGINVNHEEKDFPPSLRGRAVSLRLMSGRRLPRVGILWGVLRHLERRYPLFLQRGLGSMKAEWTSLALWLGERVQLNVGDKRRQGVLLGLTDQGGLRWRTAEGVEEVVMAGDILPRSEGSGRLRPERPGRAGSTDGRAGGPCGDSP